MMRAWLRSRLSDEELEGKHPCELLYIMGAGAEFAAREWQKLVAEYNDWAERNNAERFQDWYVRKGFSSGTDANREIDARENPDSTETEPGDSRSEADVPPTEPRDGTSIEPVQIG